MERSARVSSHGSNSCSDDAARRPSLFSGTGRADFPARRIGRLVDEAMKKVVRV